MKTHTLAKLFIDATLHKVLVELDGSYINNDPFVKMTVPEDSFKMMKELIGEDKFETISHYTYTDFKSQRYRLNQPLWFRVYDKEPTIGNYDEYFRSKIESDDAARYTQSVIDRKIANDEKKKQIEREKIQNRINKLKRELTLI